MSYQLTIEPLGETIEVEDEQTILDAALRAGIWLPHACCHGLCATCKVQVVDGDVELGEASPFALMDFERDEGKCLACCAMLEADLVIEAEIDEDPDAEVHPVEDFVANHRTGHCEYFASAAVLTRRTRASGASAMMIPAGELSTAALSRDSASKSCRSERSRSSSAAVRKP